MDMLTNMRAFLLVARLGSFAAAAREMGLATSVMTKRVTQLERSVGSALFSRSTRAVLLTETGQRWIDRVQLLVSDFDSALVDAKGGGELEGPIRIKAPTTLTMMYLQYVLAEFQRLHPRVTMQIVVTDRTVNPIDESFDVVIAVFGSSFAKVVDIPLVPILRSICVSPKYVARRGIPRHPSELSEHDTINFQPTGTIWMFESEGGPVQVDLRPTLSANDGQILLAGALAGNGIALLSNYISDDAVAEGRLVRILEDYAIPEIWMKILIPEARRNIARVAALTDFLRQEVPAIRAWSRSSPIA